MLTIVTPATRPLSRHALVLQLAGWIAPPLSRSVQLLPRTAPRLELEAITLRDALERINTPVRRAWRLAVLRRAVVFAVLIGLFLACVAGWLAWPRWLAPMFTASIIVGVTGAVQRRAPGLDAVARFLDRSLDLKEQLATALEMETAAPSTLGTQLELRATAAARSASAAWAARGVASRRECAALIVLLGAFLAMDALPLSNSRQVDKQVASGHSGRGRDRVPPALSTPPGNIPRLTVQVAVVSAQNSAPSQATQRSSTLHTRPKTPARRAVTSGRPAAERSHSETGGASPAGKGIQKAGSSAVAAGQPTLPLLRHSENFLPTRPSAKGKKGTFYSSAPAKSGQAVTGAHSSTTGAGAASGAATRAGNATKHLAQPGQSTGKQGGSMGGKRGPAGGSASPQSQCLYGCTHLLPSQLTAPGLITGKGQFTGKGLPGGQTAGHARGTAPKLGSAKAPAPTSAHQLAITSAYGRSNPGQRSSKQAQGHDGPGSTQPSVVKAGANGSQTFDYVSPDANIVPPGDSAILGRYFTSHLAP